MNAAAFVYIGCELPLASKRIALFVDTQTEAVIDELRAYSCASAKDFDDGLKADGVCLYGHGDLVPDVISALAADDKPLQKTAIALFLGSGLSFAKTRIAIYSDKDYDAARDALKLYASESYEDLNKKLMSMGINVFGSGEYVWRLVFDLTTDGKMSNEHNILLCANRNLSGLIATEKPKSESQKKQELIELGKDIEQLAEIVKSAKDNHNYPTKEELIQLFEAAFAVSKTKEGDEALLYDQICRDLKEMLYAAHRQEMVKKLEDRPPGRRFLGGFTIGK